MKLEDIKTTSSSESKTIPTQPKQGLISKVLCWYFGLSFIFASMVILFGGLGFLSSLCCFFAGAILLPPFNNQLIKRGHVLSKTAKTAIILGLIVGMGVFSNTNGTGNTESHAIAPKAENNRETAAVEVVKDSCLQVSNIFDAQSNLSDLQKDAVWEQKYKNRQFEWSMEVVEVSEGMLGGLTVQFKCQKSRSFVQDVQLSYPKEAKSTIMQFQKGSVYKVKGVLKMQSTLLGLSGDAVL